MVIFINFSTNYDVNYIKEVRHTEFIYIYIYIYIKDLISNSYHISSHKKKNLTIYNF